MDNFVEYCKKREGDLVGSQLDNEDLIDYERMQEYWTDYVKLFIPFVSCSLSEKENYFLHKTLIDKRLEKDDDGRYKIIQNPEEEKMLVSITEKLIYA
jgi:hypothetical protein